ALLSLLSSAPMAQGDGRVHPKSSASDSIENRGCRRILPASLVHRPSRAAERTRADLDKRFALPAGEFESPDQSACDGPRRAPTNEESSVRPSRGVARRLRG